MISLSSRNSVSKTYPFPAIKTSLLQSINTAIKVAWTNLLNNVNVNLNILNEEDITAHVQGEVQNILENGNIPGFSRTLIHSINRQSNFCTYDEKNLNKQPDLHISFVAYRPGLALSIYDALFIECKIIHHSNQQTTRKYIMDGIYRFIDGQYAWAMTQAMMIAYVKDQKKPIQSMTKVFSANNPPKKINSCKPKSNQYKVAFNSQQPKTIITSHDRHWVHPILGSPGDLDIMHIWLDT